MSDTPERTDWQKFIGDPLAQTEMQQCARKRLEREKKWRRPEVIARQIKQLLELRAKVSNKLSIAAIDNDFAEMVRKLLLTGTQPAEKNASLLTRVLHRPSASDLQKDFVRAWEALYRETGKLPTYDMIQEKLETKREKVPSVRNLMRANKALLFPMPMRRPGRPKDAKTKFMT